MEKITTLNDNMSVEETLKEIKEFVGLRPDQSFQEIEIEEDESDE